MTCDAMRDALVQAELSELRGEGSGPVAVHLRSCAACRRDAARILAATGQLGGAVRRRRRRGWLAAIPLAAAAALAFWIRPMSVPGPVAAPAEASAVLPAPSRAEAAPPRPATARRSVAVIPIRPSRLEGSTPAVAVAFAPVALAATPLQVSAPEPSRKHPTLLPTSDPAITVLWFE